MSLAHRHAFVLNGGLTDGILTESIFQEEFGGTLSRNHAVKDVLK